MKMLDAERTISALLFDIDKYLAILGLILAIAIFFVFGLRRGSIVGVMVSVLLFISCLLWLLMRRRDVSLHVFSDSKNLTYIWAIAFFILYSLSILFVYFRQDYSTRPLLYFILTSLMAGTIACQILTASRRHSGLILLQVILLGMSITWTQQLITPSLIGVDPWYHQFLYDIIIDQHFLIAEGHPYTAQPLFHLIISTTTILTSIPYKYSTLISVSFSMIFCFSFFLMFK